MTVTSTIIIASLVKASGKNLKNWCHITKIIISGSSIRLHRANILKIHHSRGLSVQKVPQIQLHFRDQQHPLVQKQTRSVQPLIPERTAKQGSNELGYAD